MKQAIDFCKLPERFLGQVRLSNGKLVLVHESDEMINFIEAIHAKDFTLDEVVGVTAWLSIFAAWCDIRSNGINANFEALRSKVELTPVVEKLSVTIFELPEAKALRQQVNELHDPEQIEAAGIFMKGVARLAIARTATNIDEQPFTKDG